MTGNLAYGFAAMQGGTSGGAGGKTITVTTGAQLQAAINGASGPLTIVVDGRITAANSGASEIAIDGRSNISIIGAGAGAEFDGIGIRVTDGSSNLIIRNLKIHDVAGGSGDAIGIEGPSRNIWIDSNELYSTMDVAKDHFDGLLDIKRGAEYITVSNNHFHDHHKVSLVGYSDSDTGGRYITYAHNLFENIGSRAPSVRDGYVHIYENHFKDVSTSAINVRMGAVALIENNVFERVRDPVVSLDSAEIGYWTMRGNVFRDVTWSRPGSNEAIAGTGNASTASYSVPYAYSLLGTSNLPAQLQDRAGTGNLGAPPAGSGTPPSSGGGTPPAEPPVEPPKPPPTTEPAPGTTTTRATSGADNLAGGDGNDTIDAAGGADAVRGGAGNDSLSGGSAGDTLLGDAGNDTLLGGEGRDSLSGGLGIDQLSGGASADVLDGGGGQDRLLGEDGNDVLRGEAEGDTLDGGAGSDSLSGGAGDDVLIAGDAADTLSGDAGRDVLTGGGNDDLFVFAATADSAVGAGRDVIKDFGDGDRIDLSRIDASTRAGGDQAFAFIGERAFGGRAGELHLVMADGRTIVEGDIDGDRKADFQIELEGLHRLTPDDFVL